MDTGFRAAAIISVLRRERGKGHRMRATGEKRILWPTQGLVFFLMVFCYLCVPLEENNLVCLRHRRPQTGPGQGFGHEPDDPECGTDRLAGHCQRYGQHARTDGSRHLDQGHGLRRRHCHRVPRLTIIGHALKNRLIQAGFFLYLQDGPHFALTNTFNL